MEETDAPTIDARLAERLRALRTRRGWTLDRLAAESGISRATLSRLENGAVSPTANTLGRLCAVYGLPMSRLMHLVEEGFAPVVRRAEQRVWRDAKSGLVRRFVSPPAQALAGEVVEVALEPGARIAYDAPARPGQEHHVAVLEGRLIFTQGDERHEVGVGDCLRYLSAGASRFETPRDAGVRYLLFTL